MPKIATGIDLLKQNEFPRRKIHELAHAVLEGKYSAISEKKVLAGVSDEVKRNVSNLENLLNGDRMKWLHIAELWDYALPLREVRNA